MTATGHSEKVKLLGVGIDPLRLDEMLALIRQRAVSGEHCLIAHVNIMGLNLAYEQPWLRDFYNQADAVYADGMGVLLGARLQGRRIPERYTLADWVWPLAEMAAQNDLGLFFLGNPPGVAQRAGERLQERFPALRMAGTQHGYFDRTPGGAENEVVLAQINHSGAQLLLVGFGMPRQEAWLRDNWPRLEVPVAVTVGALFEYIAGDLRRGPAWMTQKYMEWLARMLLQPRRYARRYVHDIPLFLLRMLQQRWSQN